MTNSPVKDYLINDIVNINIKDNKLVSKYEKPDRILQVKLLKIMEASYIAYTSDTSCKDSLTITEFYIKKYDIPIKYLNCKMFILTYSNISSLHRRDDGCFCTKCGEFIQLAQQSNNFTCFLCKNYKYR